MHPLLKNLRGLAAYLLAVTLGAGLVAVLAALDAAPLDWAWSLALWLPVALLTALAALALYPVCRGAPLRPASWQAALTRRAVAALVLAALVTAAAALWNSLGLLVERAGLLPLGAPAWAACLGVQLLLYLIAALAHDALLAQQAMRDAAQAEAQARLHAREMELRALRHQIDPHFLFNALNSISALTQLDAAGARAMTLDLAAFFRQTLALGGRERIRLADELDLLRSYVAIEQRRLGDKLQLALEVDEAAAQALLPPLLLQPLVENAIKHGIRLRDDGGTVRVQARCGHGRLELQVGNPLADDAPADASGLGQGLATLRARLQAQYAQATAVDVQRGAHEWRVLISLPLAP